VSWTNALYRATFNTIRIRFILSNTKQRAFSAQPFHVLFAGRQMRGTGSSRYIWKTAVKRFVCVFVFDVLLMTLRELLAGLFQWYKTSFRKIHHLTKSLSAAEKPPTRPVLHKREISSPVEIQNSCLISVSHKYTVNRQTINTIYKTWPIVIKFGTYCPELGWVNLSYGNVNIFCLTWAVTLPYLVKYSIRVL